MPTEVPQVEYCVFCNVIQGSEPSYKIYESDYIVGFLDVQPTRRGHVILVPKVHVQLLSELPEKHAAALGEALVKVTKAISLAFKNEALTVSLNQVYAQTVPHAHFHIVPAPDLRNPGTPTSQSVLRRDNVRGIRTGMYRTRQQLDDDDAAEVQEMIKSHL